MLNTDNLPAVWWCCKPQHIARNWSQEWAAKGPSNSIENIVKIQNNSKISVNIDSKPLLRKVNNNYNSNAYYDEHVHIIKSIPTSIGDIPMWTGTWFQDRKFGLNGSNQ